MSQTLSMFDWLAHHATPEPNTGCWLWLSSVSPKGYGCTTSRRDGRPVSARANRVAWMMANGADPGPLLVCHRCDQPSCVNPDHLFLGTHLDNNRDSKAKGRRRCAAGEEHGSSKLTADLVAEARQAYASGGWTQQRLADRFGVSIGTMNLALRGKTWRGVRP